MNTVPGALDRTEMLLGKEAVASLAGRRVAIFGLGGVGGYVCEALVRSGIGHFDLVDNDRICESNLNRQILATTDTIGHLKTEAARERMLQINPGADIRLHSFFFLPETAERIPFDEFDYIVDAIDTVTAKIELIVRAGDCGIPVISCMGTGNKLDASRLRVADIYDTKVCPLARVMRRELKARGIRSCRVVYSEEEPVRTGTRTPGSIAFVPGAAGLIIAGEVVRGLLFGK